MKTSNAVACFLAAAASFATALPTGGSSIEPPAHRLAVRGFNHTLPSDGSRPSQKKESLENLDPELAERSTLQARGFNHTLPSDGSRPSQKKEALDNLDPKLAERSLLEDRHFNHTLPSDGSEPSQEESSLENLDLEDAPSPLTVGSESTHGSNATTERSMPVKRAFRPEGWRERRTEKRTFFNGVGGAV